MSLPLILTHDPGEWDFLLTSAPLIVSLSVLSCWLLVSDIPLFSFKGIGSGFRKDPYPLLLIVFAAGLLSWISFAALPLIVAFYVLLSLVRNYFSTTNGK
jgi:CDP-diacylglycerol--serine O-phosphatidyltransferase